MDLRAAPLSSTLESATIICASIPSAICGRARGPIEIFDYNPKWPARFEVEASNIRSALGGSASQVEHVGSTSVPGLVAKPIIDIVLVLVDSTQENQYAPALEAAGNFEFESLAGMSTACSRA